MIEREINGATYQVGKLDARRQLHVGRRLAPVLGTITDALGSLQEDAGAMAAIGPMSRAVAAMPDDDVDYILSACLSVCQRQLPGGAGWGPVQTPQGQLMYDDIQLMQMLELTALAIQENLGPFFGDLLSMLGRLGISLPA